MNAYERRSIQRKGWLGLAGFAAVPLVGIILLSASFSLFMILLLAALLLGAFALGGMLLTLQLRAGQRVHAVAMQRSPRSAMRRR